MIFKNTPDIRQVDLSAPSKITRVIGRVLSAYSMIISPFAAMRAGTESNFFNGVLTGLSEPVTHGVGDISRAVGRTLEPISTVSTTIIDGPAAAVGVHAASLVRKSEDIALGENVFRNMGLTDGNSLDFLRANAHLTDMTINSLWDLGSIFSNIMTFIPKFGYFLYQFPEIAYKFFSTIFTMAIPFSVYLFIVPFILRIFARGRKLSLGDRMRIKMIDFFTGKKTP